MIFGEEQSVDCTDACSSRLSYKNKSANEHCSSSSQPSSIHDFGHVSNSTKLVEGDGQVSSVCQG